MIAVTLGLVAALCWSVHDLIARQRSFQIGPFRMAFWVMVAGACFTLLPVALRSTLWSASALSVWTALAMGLVYALAVAGLFKAFSLAPVSIVGPFTAGYPALVVIWGLLNGLAPAPQEWLALAIIVVGIFIVGRMGPRDGGLAAVPSGKIPAVIASTLLACVGFAATVVLGQAAAQDLGALETTFLSRFPAALVLVPFMLRDRSAKPEITRSSWTGIAMMAMLDVVAVTSINVAGQFPHKEFGAMAISAYGGMSVLLAMIILKEKVSIGQWTGIFMITAGVAVLGWPK